MTPKIQLLVLDVDGTLAGKTNQVREPVKTAVRKACDRGIQVAVATGRMYRSAVRFHREIGSNLPLISYQGALIKDPNGDRLYRHLPLCPDLTRALIDRFESPAWRDLLSIHLYIDDRLYVRDLSPETRAYAERSRMEAIAVGDLRTTLNTPATKILALSHDTAAIARLLQEVRQHYTPKQLYTTTSVATFFEAAHPEVNKGAAVRYLAESLNVPLDAVMAVGDNWNDYEMIRDAGIGVAMGDAPEDVKAVADWVAPSVEADGVAAAIDRFLL